MVTSQSAGGWCESDRALHSQVTRNPEVDDPGLDTGDDDPRPPREPESKSMKGAIKALNRTNKLHAAQFIAPKSKK